MVKHQEFAKYDDQDCRYQIGLETSMKASDLLFDCFNLLCYTCHKLNHNHGG